VLSTIAVFLGFSLQITFYEWLIIVFMITMGLVIETFNTGLEATTDAISKRRRMAYKVCLLFLLFSINLWLYII
jgi:diacylglycerol kinase